MVQEQIDFNLAVEAVVQWVETKSSWEETLVIITADHETGLLWGPNSDKEPFQPLADNGPGKMPGLMYHAKTHSNSLVPVFARGVGAQGLDYSRGGHRSRARTLCGQHGHRQGAASGSARQRRVTPAGQSGSDAPRSRCRE